MNSFTVDFSVEENGRKRPEYTLDTDLNGEISLADFLEFTKSSLIITADTVLAEEQLLGFEKNPVIVVDGRQGKSVLNVNPFGTIEIVSRVNMQDILLETYKGIIHRSPVDTGQYVKSHYVFQNGKQVATDLASLESWLASNPKFEQKDLIRFVNIQPYARKLERRGITAQNQGQLIKTRTVKSRDKRKAAQGITVAAPNGAYYLTSRAIRAKYKRNSVIKFSFISGASLGISGNFKVGRKGKPGRPYLYPTIIISVEEGGIK